MSTPGPSIRRQVPRRSPGGFPGHPLLSLLLIALCSCQSEEDIKNQQYFVEGMDRYQQHCANCHQPDGRGLAQLYPPLVGSKLLQDPAALACAMRYGLRRDTLSGYAQPMPANEQLRELDLAEIATYVRMKWGGAKVRTTIPEVRKALRGCAR
jgi:mono/diheme cytochrome c family protein